MGYTPPTASPFAEYIISVTGSVYKAVNNKGSTVASGTAFHTLLNAVINLCTTTSKIYVTKGSYTVTASITDQGRSNIELELSRGAVFNLSNNADTHMFRLDSVSNWWIHGGEINGNESNQTTPGGAGNTNSYGIYLYRTTNVKISDMIIHDFCRAGVKTEGNGGTYAVDTLITDCYMYDNNWCGYLPDTYTQGAVVHGCRFTGGGEGGVAGGTSSPIKDITVEGCTQHDINGSSGPANYNIGIYFEVGTGLKIIGNHIWNCKAGILITSAGEDSNIVSGNNIHDCTGTGENCCIIVRCDRTVVSGNICVQADQFNYAICIGSGTAGTGDYCVVEGNIIYGNNANYHGIQIARVTGCVVTGNIILLSGGHGILIDTAGNYNCITGNRVIGADVGLNINNASCTRTWVDSNNFDQCTDACTDTGTNTRFGSNVNEAGAIVIAGVP